MQIFLDAWGGLIFESASSAHLMLLFAIISTGRGNWLDSGIEEMFVFFFFFFLFECFSGTTFFFCGLNGCEVCGTGVSRRIEVQ
jgi:hypothetical protein